MQPVEVGNRYKSVDNRRPRIVVVTSVSEDRLTVGLRNEGTNRFTTVKLSRLSSHGGYKPLFAELASDPRNTPLQQAEVTDTHDQYAADLASSEGMIPRDETV